VNIARKRELTSCRVSCIVCRSMSWSYVVWCLAGVSSSSSVQRSWKPVEADPHSFASLTADSRQMRGCRHLHLPLPKHPRHSLSTFVAQYKQ
jgi:hypothetical protein